jgi:hypothetical protein
LHYPLSDTWSSIYSIIQNEGEILSGLKNCCQYSVENGKKTHFWTNSRLEHGPLKIHFSVALYTVPKAMISGMGNFFNEDWY